MKRNRHTITRALRSGLVGALLVCVTAITVGCGMLRRSDPADQNSEHPSLADAETPSQQEQTRSDPETRIDPQTMRLRTGLIMNVTVLVGGAVEIAEENKRVSDSGTIALPLLGPIKAEGHTLDSIGKLLTALYGRYFVEPQVMVDLVHDDTREGVAPWGYVTVLGRVKKPGRVPIPATRDLTVSRAIQHAGGFDTSARSNAIRVTRQNADGTQTGRDIDLQAVGARGEVDQDILLQSEDVVFVPERIF